MIWKGLTGFNKKDSEAAWGSRARPEDSLAAWFGKIIYLSSFSVAISVKWGQCFSSYLPQRIAIKEENIVSGKGL